MRSIINEKNLNNKKILFLGFPKQFYRTLKNTKHLQIPELINDEIWENQKSGIEKAKRIKTYEKGFFLFGGGSSAPS